MPDDPQAPDQGNPDEVQRPDAPETASATAEKPEFFDEKFDPASLSDELRPAYKQMRDAFSQKTQTLAQERQELREAKELRDALQDPEQAPDVLRRFGYDVEDPDQDDYDEYDSDELEQLKAQVAELRQAREAESTQAEQAQRQQAEVAYINQGLTDLQQRTGRDDFSEEEFNALGHLSTTLRDENGFPDVQAAYELLYTQVLPKERDRWVKSKSSPQAPSGRAGVQVPDLDNPQGRDDYMAQRLAQLEAD